MKTKYEATYIIRYHAMLYFCSDDGRTMGQMDSKRAICFSDINIPGIKNDFSLIMPKSIKKEASLLAKFNQMLRQSLKARLPIKPAH